MCYNCALCKSSLARLLGATWYLDFFLIIILSSFIFSNKIIVFHLLETVSKSNVWFSRVTALNWNFCSFCPISCLVKPGLHLYCFSIFKISSISTSFPKIYPVQQDRTRQDIRYILGKNSYGVENTFRHLTSTTGVT